MPESKKKSDEWADRFETALKPFRGKYQKALELIQQATPGGGPARSTFSRWLKKGSQGKPEIAARIEKAIAALKADGVDREISLRIPIHHGALSGLVAASLLIKDLPKLKVFHREHGAACFDDYVLNPVQAGYIISTSDAFENVKAQSHNPVLDAFFPLASLSRTPIQALLPKSYIQPRDLIKLRSLKDGQSGYDIAKIGVPRNSTYGKEVKELLSATAKRDSELAPVIRQSGDDAIVSCSDAKDAATKLIAGGIEGVVGGPGWINIIRDELKSSSPGKVIDQSLASIDKWFGDIEYQLYAHESLDAASHFQVFRAFAEANEIVARLYRNHPNLDELYDALITVQKKRQSLEGGNKSTAVRGKNAVKLLTGLSGEEHLLASVAASTFRFELIPDTVTRFWRLSLARHRGETDVL